MKSEVEYRDGKVICKDCGKELTPAWCGGDDSYWESGRTSGYWPHEHNEDSEDRKE